MLRGLWKLTWIEIKIFLREPLGAIGTIGVPVLVFLVVGRMVGRRSVLTSPAASSFIGVGLPVLASVLILIGAVLSLVYFQVSLDAACAKGKNMAGFGSSVR